MSTFEKFKKKTAHPQKINNHQYNSIKIAKKHARKESRVYRRFWTPFHPDQVPGHVRHMACSGSPREKITPQFKLDRLIEWCEKHGNARERYDLRYKDFRRNKRFFFLFYKPCWVCGSRKGISRHHIVPMSNNGSNIEENLVTLCRRCHAEIHPWLDCELEESLGMDSEYRAIISNTPDL